MLEHNNGALLLLGYGYGYEVAAGCCGKKMLSLADATTAAAHGQKSLPLLNNVVRNLHAIYAYVPSSTCRMFAVSTVFERHVLRMTMALGIRGHFVAPDEILLNKQRRTSVGTQLVHSAGMHGLCEYVHQAAG
eukprot:scaffold41491_cov22-Prasinocladus_malaysianus.AAC.1